MNSRIQHIYPIGRPGVKRMRESSLLVVFLKPGRPEPRD